MAGLIASRCGVARMTIQQAIRVLRDERLIVSRQGSGVFIRERTVRAVALRPHVERAFEQPKVSIDFAGFWAETLHGLLQEPLDKFALASSARHPPGARGMMRGALGEWDCVLLPLSGGRPAALSCLPTAAQAVLAECGNGVTVPGWAVG